MKSILFVIFCFVTSPALADFQIDVSSSDLTVNSKTHYVVADQPFKAVATVKYNTTCSGGFDFAQTEHKLQSITSVSYTHLTLPTTPYV